MASPTMHRGLCTDLRLRCLFFVFAGALLLGCREPAPDGDQGLELEMVISPTPPGVGPARLIITLEDSAGTPLTEAVVEVEGNMSHAGMVPVRDKAVMSEPGIYLVPSFRFSMAGDWILTVEVTLPDGRKASFRRETIVASVPPGLSPDTGEGNGMQDRGAEARGSAGADLQVSPKGDRA